MNYYLPRSGKDEDLTVNVDVRTIATILAINLGVFKIRDSGLNRVDEFAESAVFPEEIRDKGHFYVDVSRISFSRVNNLCKFMQIVIASYL